MFYNTYTVKTEEESLLLEMYCEAKPFWWRMFFGLRGGRNLTNGKVVYFYKVPRKAWDLCQTFVKHINK